jgi:uncharacterized paraquat-inducible protein A
MGLMPDKPNPVRVSIASPRDGTRVCTRCYKRLDDALFRWLLLGKRKASQCKRCEYATRSRLRDQRLATLAQAAACL